MKKIAMRDIEEQKISVEGYSRAWGEILSTKAEAKGQDTQ